MGRNPFKKFKEALDQAFVDTQAELEAIADKAGDYTDEQFCLYKGMNQVRGVLHDCKSFDAMYAGLLEIDFPAEYQCASQLNMLVDLLARCVEAQDEVMALEVFSKNTKVLGMNWSA